MRKSGVFLPIFSLPSAYGIGDFSESAYAFVDFLKAGGQSFWQILPLGPTGYGNSPYQTFSAFAGNPYMISLTALQADGLLTRDECASIDFGESSSCVDYAALYQNRIPLLKKAFSRSGAAQNTAFKTFCALHSAWLSDFSLFMALKLHFDGASWLDWEPDIRNRTPAKMAAYRIKLDAEIQFWCWTQFIFFSQWEKLRSYMHDKGISVIGDVPIYVSMDSSDAWANPALFQFDESGKPIKVSGCPPDSFSPKGQLWGNPLYDWSYHQKSSFSWWLSRLRHSFLLYDILRIDHFRGFSSYYAVPYGKPDARTGHWETGPGEAFINAIAKHFSHTKFIAEDLGFITPPVRALLKESGFKGMEVFPFSFSAVPPHLPSAYPAHTVAYPSTHDTLPLSAWLSEGGEERRAAIRTALDCEKTPDVLLNRAVLSALMASPSSLCILPMQDLLGLSARINTPGTLPGNWEWRLSSEESYTSVLSYLSSLTEESGRK